MEEAKDQGTRARFDGRGTGTRIGVLARTAGSRGTARWRGGSRREAGSFRVPSASKGRIFLVRNERERLGVGSLVRLAVEPIAARCVCCGATREEKVRMCRSLHHEREGKIPPRGTEKGRRIGHESTAPVALRRERRDEKGEGCENRTAFEGGFGFSQSNHGGSTDRRSGAESQ